MVVGAGAAFSDQSKIKNTEAVDMCTALNIIGGYPDGTFKPEGNITRAEVTKMICVALNGGKNPAVSTNTTPTFSDVRNNANAAWAEGYIESCAAQGIVSGVGGGKFAPNGNVTGVQLAKMLLVSLGYKSENEGFTGNAWATNVNVRAAQKGLYKGLESMDTNAALTRDNAAQMVWNALQAYEVEYKTNLVADKDGKLSTQITVQDKVVGDNNDKITLMYDKYDRAQEVDGRLTGFTYDSTKAEWTYTLSDRDTGAKVGEFTSKQDFTELYMQNVTAVFNYENKKGSTKVDTFYGMYADESVVLASGFVGDLDTVAGESKKVKLDSTEYKTESTLGNVKAYAFNQGQLTGLADLSALIKKAGANAAYSIKLIDLDNNAKVDLAVIVPATVAKVTYVGSARVTAGRSYKFEDCNIYKDIAKDDFAVIVKSDYTAKNEDTLTKADTVKGEVSGLKTGKIKVEGKWYTLAEEVKAPEVGDTVQLAVVGSYAYDVDTTVGASKDILLISKSDKADDNLSNDYTIEARAYFPDGTNKKIIVDKLEGKDLTQKSVLNENTMYTYSKDKDGNYELKEVGKSNLAGTDDFTTGTYDAAKDSIDGKKIADNAIIFVVSTKDSEGKDKIEIKVKTGKTVKDWKTSTKATVKGALIDEVSNINYVTYAALVVDGDQPNAAGDLQYAYLLADRYETKLDGDKVTAYDVWNGSKEVTLYEDKSGQTVGSFAEGTAIAYHEDGTYITDVASLKPYAITGFDGKSEGDIDLIEADKTTNTGYTLDKDCVVIAMDDAAIKGAEGSLASVSLAQKIGSKSVPNAYIAFDDGKVIAIVYDINGQLYEYAAETKDPTYTATAKDVKVPSATVKVELNDDSGFKKGDTLKVTVKKTDGKKFGAGTYGIKVTGATEPATQKVEENTKDTLIFDVTVASSDIVITEVTKN